MTAVPNKRYMRLNEVADYFEVDERTLKSWWLSGKTCLQAWRPVHLVGKRGLCFTTASVVEFERQCHISPEDWTE